MVFPALGTALLGGVASSFGGSLISGLFGGNSSSSDNSQQQQQQAAGYQGSPLDFYAKYGAAAAAANNPLSLATSEFGNALANSTYGQALLAQALQQGSATALADAATRGNTATQLQANEVAQLLNRGIGLQEDLAKARLGVALLSPQFMAQSATAAREGDNALAKSLGETNLGIRALQEASKANIAQEFSRNLGTLATTRAAAQQALASGAQRIAGQLSIDNQQIGGQLALGDQRISGQLQLGDQNIMGNLTLNKAKTESDLARIRANTAATKDLRSNAVNIAMAGQRYFS